MVSDDSRSSTLPAAMYSAAPFTAAGLLHHRVGLSVLHGVAACPCDPVDWGSPSRLLRGAHRRPRPLDHGRRHDKHPWARVLVPDPELLTRGGWVD
jgi:hypothetical protein